MLKNKKVRLNTDKPIYLVEWWDAHSAAGWFFKRELEDFIKKEKCICVNIGWIVHETKDEIVMACRTMKFSEEGDSQWGLLQKIPRTWIRKKIVLKGIK